MIIPLKMQSMFVNIHFPEPKGASQLVCHLFIGPESCTLKPNRPLSDPLGKVFQLQPLTCIDLYYSPKTTLCGQPYVCKQTYFISKLYIISKNILDCISQHQEHIKYLSPFFFKKAFLVAKGLSRTFGFCRNFTAVEIWKETNVISVFTKR